jgi:hypothetical protein
VFNLYLPPPRWAGDPGDVKPWLDHIRKIYPDDIDHIVCWFAHRVQRPWEKINHALFLGGDPRIGKDTMIERVKRTVGHWNCSNLTNVRLTRQKSALFQWLAVPLWFPPGKDSVPADLGAFRSQFCGRESA